MQWKWFLNKVVWLRPHESRNQLPSTGMKRVIKSIRLLVIFISVRHSYRYIVGVCVCCVYIANTQCWGHIIYGCLGAFALFQHICHCCSCCWCCCYCYLCVSFGWCESHADGEWKNSLAYNYLGQQQFTFIYFMSTTCSTRTKKDSNANSFAIPHGMKESLFCVLICSIIRRSFHLAAPVSRPHARRSGRIGAPSDWLIESKRLNRKALTICRSTRTDNTQLR